VQAVALPAYGLILGAFLVFGRLALETALFSLGLALCCFSELALGWL
jgi:hypothetical protein